MNNATKWKEFLRWWEEYSKESIIIAFDSYTVKKVDIKIKSLQDKGKEKND